MAKEKEVKKEVKEEPKATKFGQAIEVSSFGDKEEKPRYGVK